MRVLDLFSGLGGFSEPFRDRGHEVVTLDIDSKFKPDIVADVRNIRYPSLSIANGFDVVLASPPCPPFSLAANRVYWPKGEPTKEVNEALGLVASTFRLIARISPEWWVLENPRGFLRKLIGRSDETIYLCSFGTKWQKPTDLWGRWPGEIGRPCAPHDPNPTGGQGSVPGTAWHDVRDPALRAKLPYGLGEELCKRMEAA